MAHKYLKGGALNPVWVDEQRANDLAESMLDVAMNIISLIDFNKEAQQNEYETKFNFIKNHSDSEEDKELAKKIIGI